MQPIGTSKVLTSMPRIPDKAQTDGSSTFDPDKFFEAWGKDELTAPYDNDIRKFIIRSFGLQLSDDYIYTAVAEVSLLQAQTYVEFGGQGRLHEWYKDDEGVQVRVELLSCFSTWRTYLIPRSIAYK